MKTCGSLLIGCFLFLSMSNSLTAQINSGTVKTWYSLSVNTRLTKNLSATFGQFYGFDVDPYEKGFGQKSFRLSFKGGKHLSLSAGYSKTTVSGKEQGKSKSRFYGGVSWKSKLGVWRISNGLRYEKHSQEEKRYSGRVIYSFLLRPKSKLLVPKIRLTPFLGTQFYYNIGGKPLRQYDSDGTKLAKVAPYGLHRFRVRWGISFKPVKAVKFTFYNMYQKEFNTKGAINNHHQINVENPETKHISRRFSNYLVFGVNAKLYLRHVFSHNNKRSHRKTEKADEPDLYPDLMEGGASF